MHARLRSGAAARVGASAVALAACAALLGSSAALAADANAGKAEAQPCSLCHGALGLSSAPDAPNLAAQPAIYLAAQLRAFRSGERKHEVMNLMAKPLSDADIENLAEWYGSIKVEARGP
jgi:cytochrome c553